MKAACHLFINLTCDLHVACSSVNLTTIPPEQTTSVYVARQIKSCIHAASTAPEIHRRRADYSNSTHNSLKFLTRV